MMFRNIKLMATSFYHLFMCSYLKSAFNKFDSVRRGENFFFSKFLLLDINKNITQSECFLFNFVPYVNMHPKRICKLNEFFRF